MRPQTSIVGGQTSLGFGQTSISTLTKGGGASHYASFIAPAGFRWGFVTLNGLRITMDGDPVVALVEA